MSQVDDEVKALLERLRGERKAAWNAGDLARYDEIDGQIAGIKLVMLTY